MKEYYMKYNGSWLYHDDDLANVIRFCNKYIGIVKEHHEGIVPGWLLVYEFKHHYDDEGNRVYDDDDDPGLVMASYSYDLDDQVFKWHYKKGYDPNEH